MQLFHDTLDECGFIDLGFFGWKFMWKKYFANGQSVWEKLDRALENNDWLIQFGGTKFHHLQSDNSDHCPLWIVPAGLEPPRFQKQFHFEEMWLSDPRCTNKVEAVWSSHVSTNLAIQTAHKIEKCGTKLKRWSQKNFGNVKQELQWKRELLHKAENEAKVFGVNNWVRELKVDIKILG